MKPRRRSVAIGAAVAALGLVVAGAVAATSRSTDERALQRTRHAEKQGIEWKVNNLLSQMTLDGEAAAAAAALGRPDHRRGRQGRRRLGLQPHRSGRRSTTSSTSRSSSRGCTSRSCSPTTRSTATARSSRSRWRAASSFDPSVATADDTDRRSRDGDRRHQADLQPDGRRLARAALGPDRRGRRRGPVPRLGLRRRARQGRAGHRLLRARQGRHERQALRRLRPARGRPRVQHDRHVRAAAAQPLPAAVQGRDRRRRRHGDVLVQRDQRRARAARTTRLETDILKHEWGFDGFIESDYTAVAELRACPPKNPTPARAATASPPTARTRLRPR